MIGKGLCYLRTCGWQLGQTDGPTPPEPPVPEFYTFAIVNDPDQAGFTDWSFVGWTGFDGCNTQFGVFDQHFGVDSNGCFDGAQLVGGFYQDWANNNGTPPPDEATYDRDQTATDAYLFYYDGQNDPPDMQITTALSDPVDPAWVIASPEDVTITFLVNEPSECYIEALLYGYDDITTYEFGSYNTTVMTDPAWEAYFHSILPKASPSVITSSINGKTVTVTVTNAKRALLRGIRWQNDINPDSGTAFFTTL